MTDFSRRVHLDRLATHPEKRPADETEDEMRARHRRSGYGNWPPLGGKTASHE